jgi:hypothetical protein
LAPGGEFASSSTSQLQVSPSKPIFTIVKLWTHCPELRKQDFHTHEGRDLT